MMYKTTKIKLNLTRHAKQRLYERFGLLKLPKIYQKNVEYLESDGARKFFHIKDTNIIFVRNNRSHNVVTFLKYDTYKSNIKN